MIPSTYNFPKHKKGDTFNGHTFQISTGPEGGPFNYVDFSNAVAKLQLKRGAFANKALEWTSEDGSIVFDVDGKIIMNAKTGVQMDIEAGIYYYDLQVVLGNGVTNTYLTGTFEIVNDYTR